MGSSEKPTTRRYSPEQKLQAVRLVRRIESHHYSAKVRPPSARAVRDAVFAVTLLAIWNANYSVYGVHKMCAFAL